MNSVKVFLVGACLVLATLACNFPTPGARVTPTPEPTLTLEPSATIMPLPPTLTLAPTFTDLPPTLTPFIPTPTEPPLPTPSPLPPTLPPTRAPPTPTFPPTSIPQATVAFVGDQFKQIDLPQAVRDSRGKQWISFVTINDLKPTTTPGTPTGSTESQTVYLAGVDGSRLKVIDLPSSVDRRVYWSPNGAYMAYLLPDGDAPGLYVIDLELSTSTRLFAIRDLSPRGVSITPTWSPDSKTIAVTLPKPYEFDIFTVGADAGRFTNLTSSESVEMWAAWSPDGSMIAFVSDRIQCPSYLPSATPTCTPPGSDPKSPEGGNLYVFDVGTKQTRFLSDQWVIAPPKWISPTRIGFTSGARNDPTAGNSLGWVEARGGSVAVQVTTPGNAGTPRYANSEFWSPDASKVIYQEYETTTRIVIRDANGNELARSNELNFPRYLFAAAWTPNSERVVLGGRNAQCPFGMLITDGALKTLMTAAAGSVGVCNPVWSSDGRYVLYEGTSRGASRDGRVDIYLSETSGYGARALSSRLSGQIKLLGWVGR